MCVWCSSICFLKLIKGESAAPAPMDAFLMMCPEVNMQSVTGANFIVTSWLHHWFLSNVESNMNKYSHISMWERKWVKYTGSQRCLVNNYRHYSSKVTKGLVSVGSWCPVAGLQVVGFKAKGWNSSCFSHQSHCGYTQFLKFSPEIFKIYTTETKEQSRQLQ